MPPLPSDDDASDADIPANGIPAHTESGVEADVEAKDQLKDDLMSDIEQAKGAKAAKKEKKRVSPTASNEDLGSDNEDEEEEEQQYEVEAIRDHEWRKKKGKGKTWVLLYNVKWKNYPETENTLEPEENLLGSRDILANYHHKIGGAPQPPTSDELKKKPSKKSLRDESAASATETSPPPAKRQKRMKKEESPTSDDLEPVEETFGTWIPKKESWEADIKQIQTVERDQNTNDLYILMIFKNGKKSRAKNSLVRKKCPQRLLDFYEAHLSV